MLNPLFAIIDDEPDAIENLKIILDELGHRHKAFNCCGEFLSWFKQERSASGLFLDIEMPGLTGIQMLETFPDLPPTIFATGHSEHFLEAMNLSPVDYLLKPIIDKNRVQKAITALLEGKNRPILPKIQKILESKSIQFSGNGGFGQTLIDFNKVSHFSALEKRGIYAWIGANKFKTDFKTLNDVNDFFPASAIFRIHRNLIVRINAITGIKTSTFTRKTCLEVPGHVLAVSRGHAKELKALIGL